MLARVDLVPVAQQQADVLGREVGPDHVIAIDLSDIHKKYAKKMAALCLVRDGSTGETAVPGYGLVSATAFDTRAGHKGMPLPLVFEAYSTVTTDFVSEPAIWLQTIDAVCCSTKDGVIAIDRAADNRRILRRLVLRERDFVVRIKSGKSCRNLLVFGRKMLVSKALDHARDLGEIEAVRLSEDGRRSAYKATVATLKVRVAGPGLEHKQMWLCVFRSEDYKHPLVVLTSLKADTLERAGRVLAMYFGRWAGEEMHRFAKQSFKLENVRTLSWRRTRNLVAATCLAMGVMARMARLPQPELVLRSFERAARTGGARRGSEATPPEGWRSWTDRQPRVAQRVLPPLTKRQFWGYALADGVAAVLRRGERVLVLVPWLMPPRRPPDLQLALL